MDIKVGAITDIKIYCRTCMNVQTNVNMCDIYSHSTESTSIINVLKVCTSIEDDRGDGMPEQICVPCFEQLMSYYDFRKRVEFVEQKLRELLRNNNVKQEYALLPNKNDTVKVESPNIELPVEFLSCDSVGGDDDLDNSDFLLESLPGKLVVNETNEKRPKSYTCKVCRESFNKLNELREHTLVHNETQRSKVECDICKRTFDRASKLQRHLQMHNPNLRPFACTFCPKRFKRQTMLISHLVSHGQIPLGEGTVRAEDTTESNEIHTCKVCSATFPSMHSLSAHMRKHNVQGRILSCPLCGKVFKKLSHLKRHAKSHVDNRPFRCNICPKTFIIEEHLTEHINKHKGLKPHACPLCGKAFSLISTLNTHIRTHTRERPYLCPTCGKRFDSSTNLNQHMKRHAGDKSFACSFCPGRYVSKGELQSHMSTHTGARPFVCDICGSAFTKPNSLTKHKLRHMGIKPHECDVCAMKFTSKDHLKRHYRIHTGEKPYKCDMCERAFTQSNDLVKHKRSHLGDKMYKCTVCSESFRLKTELRHHTTSHFISTQVGAGIPTTLHNQVFGTPLPEAKDQAPNIVIIEYPDVSRLDNGVSKTEEKIGSLESSIPENKVADIENIRAVCSGIKSSNFSSKSILK